MLLLTDNLFSTPCRRPCPRYLAGPAAKHLQPQETGLTSALAQEHLTPPARGRVRFLSSCLGRDDESNVECQVYLSVSTTPLISNGNSYLLQGFCKPAFTSPFAI